MSMAGKSQKVLLNSAATTSAAPHGQNLAKSGRCTQPKDRRRGEERGPDRHQRAEAPTWAAQGVSMGHQASADVPRAPCNRSEVVAIGALRRLLQIASSGVSLSALPRGYRAALAPRGSVAARGGYQPFKGFLPAIFMPLSTPPPAGKLLVSLRPLTTQIRRVVVSLCACGRCIPVVYGGF